MRFGLGACRVAGYLSGTILAFGALSAGHATAVSDSVRQTPPVQVTPQFFNPSLGQSATIALTGIPAADLIIEILDRDRFVIRTLKPAEMSRIQWDGRDDAGEIVPDEAYSVRIVREDASGSRAILYDPSADFAPEPLEVKDLTYSRQQGILSYTLPVPTRVHVQAGQAQPHPETGEPQGPVLKTIVDRQPRAGGTIVESWNGRDESGSFYVPDLPNFVVSVFAAPLPESSLVTVGNRKEDFLAYARRSRPPPASEPRSLAGHPRGHASLNAFEDRSPSLVVRPDASFDDQSQAWVVQGPLRLTVEVEAAAAPYFLAQPTGLYLFVDAKVVLRMKSPDNPVHLTIPREQLPPGEHRAIVNWASQLGPVGVQAFRIHVSEAVPSVAEDHP